MKKTLIASAIALSTAFSFTTVAEEIDPGFTAPIYWGNIYGDYLNKGGWFTTNEDHSEEAVIIGFEGGIIGATYEIYGFTEGNITDENTFTKLTGHKKIFGDVTLYTQGVQFSSDGFDDTNIAVGFGYKGIKGDSYSLSPWVGVNHNAGSDEESTMVGWSGMYTFSSKVYMTHWNEVTFKDAGTDVRGDFGLYHKLPHNTYVGIQYRYADTNAGDAKYDDNLAIRFGINL